MSDTETINQIIKLKKALASNDDVVDPKAPYIGDFQTNRNQKLKRGADQVYRSRLQTVPYDGYDSGIGEYQGHRRAIISNKKLKKNHTPTTQPPPQSIDNDSSVKPEAANASAEKKRKTPPSTDTDVEDNDQDIYQDDDADPDPYAQVNISSLLAPLTDPANLPSHPAMARAFTSKTIRGLARRALDIVNEEHKHTVQFARLMSVFLGDDPMYLKVDKLNLPTYDHLGGITDKPDTTDPSNATSTTSLINGSTGLPSTTTTTTPTITPSSSSSTATTINGSATEPTGETTSGEPASALSTSSSAQSVLKSKSGRSAQSLSSDLEPFFGLPQIHVDRDYGIKPEDAEEARQLTQIAQQRSEEFIRCMVKVRHGLLRAERYQTKVYRWCREMAGDEDDSDGMEGHDTKSTSTTTTTTNTSEKKKKK